MTANYLFFSCFSLTKKHPLLQGHTPLSEKAEELRKKVPAFFSLEPTLLRKADTLFFQTAYTFLTLGHNRPALLLGLKIHRSVQTTKTSLSHLYISDLFVFLQP